jgi:parallel beta-helix repeat protein
MRKHFTRLVCCGGSVVGLLLACLGGPSRALAGGIVGTGSPDSCTEAALDAALTGPGTITFSCGKAPATITVTNVKSILANTTIDGNDRITLSGGGTTQVLSVNDSHVALTLLHLTIRDAFSALPGGYHGAAVFNRGTLSVAGCTFVHNHSDDLAGGAIANFRKLSVTSSTFVDNSASGHHGGAIFNTATLNVTNSTFVNNSAVPGNLDSGGDGGAIANYGKLTVTNTTFSNNSATDKAGRGGLGGAIFNFGRFSVSNSTFANNTASQVGGGICTFDVRRITVTNCTFIDNTTVPGRAGAIGGFGIEPSVTLRNTIVANTTGDPNCDAFNTDKGHNIDSGTSCGLNSSKGSLSNTDPRLDPTGLADHGGPTQTIAVDAGSPAINAGDNAGCRVAPVSKRDQRGFARPGTDGKRCTIGAYEFNSPSPFTR